MAVFPLRVYILLLLLVIPAAVWDIRTRRIPNWLTFGGIVMGFGLNWFLFEKEGILISLKGLGLSFVIYFALYLLRGMGAGDVKLMAAIGSLIGPINWLILLFCTAVIGALLGLIVIFAKQRGGQTAQNLFLILTSLRRGQAPYKEHPNLDVQNASTDGIRLPHGVAIALGTVAFLVAGWIWAPK